MNRNGGALPVGGIDPGGFDDRRRTGRSVQTGLDGLTTTERANRMTDITEAKPIETKIAEYSKTAAGLAELAQRLKEIMQNWGKEET